MFRKIYIASSWKNKDKVRALAGKLRSLGHEVFDFTDRENRPKGTDWFNCPADKWDGPPLATMEYKAFLKFATSQHIFTADMSGLHWADTVILYLPSGRSSHMEAGWGAGAGKDLFILGDLPLGEFDSLYFLAKECYHEAELPALLETLANPFGKVVCAWCQSPDHLSKDCPSSQNDAQSRAWRAITDPLIEGDYIGSLRGEVNICLNVIHYHKSFEKAVLELLPQRYDEIRRRANVIRARDYGRLPW
jgi:hypothetical protein